MAYLNLEHKILKKFKQEAWPKKLLVAVSGGRDSMVLLSVLSSLKKQLELQLKAVYVHHGFSADGLQEAYRNRAGETLRQYCQSQDVELLSNDQGEQKLSFSPDKELKSEAEFREFREGLFAEWLGSHPGWCLALGHHLSDLLENRLIQMIRGCGRNGFLSLQEKAEVKLRPLISISEIEVKEYCEAKKLHFVEDPSNSSNTYLRNWLRNDWLPQLESHRPGSVARLSQSLEHIALELREGDSERRERQSKVYNAEGRFLQRKSFCQMSQGEQLATLSDFLRAQGLNNFTKNNLFEVLKQLDTPQKTHTFTLMQRNWHLSDNKIFLRD